MRQKTVYFRADGNSRVGLGHVTRCLALADMLVEYFQCTFLVQNPALELANQIQQNNHNLISLPETNDYLAEARVISQQHFSVDCIVVLDGYEFRTGYQQIVKASGCMLVCIDDLHAWHFVADAVINHAGGVKANEYSAHAETRLFLGPRYAILRQPFLRAAQQARILPQLNSVFICFGGADSFDLTTRAIHAALSCSWLQIIHVVIGSAYAYVDRLTLLGNLHSRIRLYRNLEAQSLADVMASCEIAISPASGIAYEICSVSMGLIVGHCVENQEYLYGYLTNNNLGLAAEDFSPGRIEEALTKIQQVQPKMLLRQREQFDGKSVTRLLGIFISLAMTIKQASMEDMSLYYRWANDTETRRNSIQSENIDWKDHQKWFRKRIDTPAHVFFLFQAILTPVGQVRFDIGSTDATISYSVDTQFRGMGLGYEILFRSIAALSSLHPEKKIIGVVKNDNFASFAIFRKLGFTIKEQGSSVTRFEKS